jgi:hypothetical protein
MIARPKINLGKYACTSELIKKIINPGQRILVFDSDFIESMIVNTHPLRVILLWDKDNRGSPW